MKKNTTSANLRKVRKSERLVLASLSLGELRQIEEGEGGFLMKSVLSGLLRIR